MTPPTMAPTFDDFFIRLLLSPWLVGFTVADDGEPLIDDGEPVVDDDGLELVEVGDSGIVEGAGAKDSGVPPAALAATELNPSPMV